ncbi:MAG: glycosidase [Acidobacteriota bacterium]
MNGDRFRNLGVNLFARHPANPVVTTADLPYPANSVFNAAAAEVGGETVLLARVEDLRGISHLTVLRSEDGVSGWRCEGPSLVPDPGNHPEELWGLEDPRAVWLEELRCWGVTYTAYSPRGPLVSLALTEDFHTFHRRGPICPPDDKNAALFPRRFGGQWALLHRPTTKGQEAHVWISFSSDLKHWGDPTVLLECRKGAWWDSARVGACPPPLETPEGWLLLYHGVRQTVSGAIYRLGLALLDLEDPRKVLRRSAEWVFGPRAPYELSGDVPNVVFPCGWILDRATGRIRLYYGAADTCIGLAEARLPELLTYLRECPAP